MPGNKFNISLLISFSLIIISLVFFSPEVYALTWDEFAQSMNEAFSKKEVFTLTNLFFLIIALLFIYGLVMIIRYDTIRTDRIRRQAYQEFQQDLLAKKELLKGSNNRSWFRLPLQMEFKWEPLLLEEEEEVNPKARPREYAGLLLDLSGGGMLFQTTELLNLKEQITVWLPLDETTLELTAEVVRTQKKQEKDKTYYLIGVKFVNIREGIRDKIISWILKCESELLQEKEEIYEEEPANDEENVMAENEAPHVADEDKTEDKEPVDTNENKDNIIDLLSYSKANFSGEINNNIIAASLMLENKEPVKLQGRILDTVHKNINSTIIILEINELEK